jgi:NAD(P)H-quinone oxidoreductase subunit 5
MIHKASWKQAKESGLLALKNFIIGFISLTIALAILCSQAKSYKISEIILSENINNSALIISCFFIVITAFSQSAIFPFQSWLISSLNSPTPASALMHAGLVNGGGVILTRFSPLLFKSPELMNLIFLFGIFTALIAMIWKLMQSNVKAMLACSTISQMGFMISQCGLGLFAIAIAHLLWHGLFKSYLFLSSPSVWQEKRLEIKYPPSLITFVMSLICGVLGALIFIKVNEISFDQLQTILVLVLICFISATQMALTIINKFSFTKFSIAIFITTLLSTTYSFGIVFVENLMPKQFYNPQPLNLFHVITMFIIFSIWMIRIFWNKEKNANNKLILKLYVKLLNSSQPSFKTITNNRNQYNFK